jgi:hypothetical protein
VRDNLRIKLEKQTKDLTLICFFYVFIPLVNASWRHIHKIRLRYIKINFRTDRIKEVCGKYVETNVL